MDKFLKKLKKRINHKVFSIRNPEKMRAYFRKWYWENQDKVIAYRRKHREEFILVCRDWRKKNLEKVRLREKLYRKNNPEKVKTARRKYNATEKYKIGQKRYYEKNKVEICKRKKQWREQNHEKSLQMQYRWRKKHPDKWRAACSRYHKTSRYKFIRNARQERESGLSGKHSFSEWEKLKDLFKHTCPMCRRKEPDITLTRDHIIPVTVKGSTNWIWNIQPLCLSCNSKKKRRIIKFSIPE